MTSRIEGIGTGTLEGQPFIVGEATLIGRGTLFGYIPFVATAATVFIDGVEPLVEFTTFDYIDRVAERSSSSFVAWDLDGNGWHFKEGHPVTVVNPDGVVVLQGYVADVEESVPNIADGAVAWQIAAVDYHYLTDKRIVADAFQNQTVSAIVHTIIDTVLTDEGVTAGDIEVGPTLAETAFGYVTASRALDSLANLTGMTWWIDTQKRLHFKARIGTTTATVDASDMVAAPKVRRRSPDYRNRQYVRGVKAYTDIQVESFVGDGTRQAFLLAFRVGLAPAITVNAVAQTVGIRGLDSGRQWYWNKNDNTLSQENGDTALASTDTLVATYNGMYEIVVVSDEPAEIDRRQILEGSGTGRVEAVQNVTDTFGRAAAFDIGSGLLGTYAVEGCEVKFITTRTDLSAGQYIDLDLPEHDITGPYLVVEVAGRDFDRNVWTFDVSLIIGADPGSWAARLAAGLEPQDVLQLRENVSEDETLLLLATFSEPWGWGDLVLQEVHECPVPSTSLYPLTTLYPC